MAAALESVALVPSVQELIKNPTFSIPKSYIDPNKQALANVSECNYPETLPTFDLALLVSEETSMELEFERLHSACKEWGGFQLVNHGFNSLVMDNFKKEMEGFFELPLEEKMKYKVRQGDITTEGYGDLKKPTSTLNWGDRFFVVTNPISRRRPYFIQELSTSFRENLEGYVNEMERVAGKVLGTIAKALKIEKKEVEEMFGDGLRSIKMNYYPPCPQPELVNGYRPHTDGSGLTILNQLNDVDGLEAYRNGVWLPISIASGALVVVFGNILEIASNGIYKGILHRAAVNEERARISAAYFVSPKSEGEVGPLKSLIGPESLPMYKTIGIKDYAESFFSHNLLAIPIMELLKIEPSQDPNNHIC